MNKSKMRPDCEGFWWMLQGGEWSIGKAEMIWWGDNDEGENVLSFSTGGCFRRCDTINLTNDEGIRFYQAQPPFNEYYP